MSYQTKSSIEKLSDGAGWRARDLCHINYESGEVFKPISVKVSDILCIDIIFYVDDTSASASFSIVL
jgi:hypothetical protein